MRTTLNNDQKKEGKGLHTTLKILTTSFFQMTYWGHLEGQSFKVSGGPLEFSKEMFRNKKLIILESFKKQKIKTLE